MGSWSVSSTITCSGGTWQKEVSWSLSCSDGTSLIGGAPYTSSGPLAVVHGATCTLDMSDSWGDGWNGNVWSAPGFGQSSFLANGRHETKTFAAQLPSASSTITCSGGTWQKEVSWSLSCSDGTTLNGGAPYTSRWPLAVVHGVTCTLDMSDSWGDGWNGNVWSAPGFGQSSFLGAGDCRGCGRHGTKTFVAQLPLSASWTKHENLYCDSYAYRGNNWFSEANVDAALQRCADDPGCRGIGEWHCGDGQYRYCGKAGWGLQNYNAVGECTWEKPDQ